MDTNLYRKLQVLILILGLGASSAFAAPELTYDELTTVADDRVVITWVTSNEVSNTGIDYGLVLPTATYVTDEGASRKNYHYLTLSGLYPNTRYVYRIFSENTSGDKTYGELKSFKTLEPPSGQLLFTFASITDSQVATDVASTEGARGRPYPLTGDILGAAVNCVNLTDPSPSFTVVKGDLIDHRTSDPAGQSTIVQTKLGNLSSQVFPIPGNHEKEIWASKSSGWYDVLLKPILDLDTNSPALPAEFTNFSRDANIIAVGEETSVYNYSFDYRGYHFVMLDSVHERDVNHRCDGHVNTVWLENNLTANAGKKTFIFMHYVITDEAVQIPEEIITEVTGGSTDMNKIDLDNRADFLNVLTTHKTDVVGVFMGHIHDSSRYYLDGYDFPFVRTAATVQYPVGYNIYKVYSNGYMQLFYKVPNYTEIARDQITPEAGYSDTYWEQFGFGSEYARNFVTTFSEVQVPPTIESTAPSHNSTNVALNQPVIITFTKQMSTETTQNAVTIDPDVSAKSSSWSNSDTTLTISHSGFSASTAHTVTVGDAARSQDNIQIAAPFSFSFTSGTTTATSPPEAVIDEITNDITNDPTPAFTGIATDEISTIINVEYRISTPTWSDWNACTPLDGAFDSNQEAFTFTVTSEVTRGQHEIQIRCTNAAGVSTQTDFASYSFYYVGTRPEIILKADGTEIINGDPIKASPSFEVTVVTDKGLSLSNLTFYLNQSPIDPTIASQESNTTRTYAFYNPTLSDKTQDVRVEAIDGDGNVSSREAIDLLVQATGDVRIFGVPLNYPNPFDPGAQSTTISYVLSRASNVELNIFDLAGNLLVKQSYSSGQDGGKAGYNEVTWDGKANGNYAGNGIYPYLIVADGTVPQNGKGKLTVFKQ